MGAEFTDPIKNCCSCNEIQMENGQTIGNNTSYGFDDYLSQNMDWVIKIQAVWRGKVMRMRFFKRREEARKKSTHFLVQD